MSKKLEGRITISRPMGYDEEGVIFIRIEDQSTGIRFCDVEMSLPNFARAVTGSHVPCEFEVRGTDHLGWNVETKREWIRDVGDVDPEYFLRDWEEDGWTARGGDYGNQHRRAQKDGEWGYWVHFKRFVRPEEG